ncbi:unnamed protein product [Acanthoscelides obtectus]|uniref:NADPH:adrenodoxin oxidoreductase, mitochondrial n=1 Tax=Acanthoscelides obtectus TaxID=200917 RepID=A0A9P0MHW0_ACAOB|nr:unnamed protein product [Acanthoscelides obtectus]CAK1622300.1 NADPH:adrenodoxin oxidoreductase, mitochondrial [Acanthoscelides obtectus]
MKTSSIVSVPKINITYIFCYKMKSKLWLFKRLYSQQLPPSPKICIVGAGPAGFYAAQHLLKKIQDVQVDMYERLPVPFGLVRFGVAPDHPEVKNVINTFTKTAENPKLRFLGNMTLGADVSLEVLKKAYHIVLLSYGSEECNQLEIPGEEFKNCINAKRVVGWYNGIPKDRNLEMDLSGENVVILGQGNVAIDVARILLKSVDELRKTDITSYALEALQKSKVKRVYLVGRRGPLQAAFTIKELREVLKLPSCSTIWRKEDFTDVEKHIPKLKRPRKRITELMLQSVNENKVVEGQKEFRPVFYRAPSRIEGYNKNKVYMKAIVLCKTILEGDTDHIHKMRAISTEDEESIDCSLVIPSIGYKAVPADTDIPFDHNKGIVMNQHYKVKKGLYVCGWLGTGPRGVILNTMNGAFEAAEVILKDISEGHLTNEPKGGFEEVKKGLNNQGLGQFAEM